MEFAAISVISTFLVTITLGSATGAMQTQKERQDDHHSAFLTPGLRALQGVPVSQRPDLFHWSSHILGMSLSVCLSCSTMCPRNRSTPRCPCVLPKAWANILGGWQGLIKHFLSDQESGLYKTSTPQMLPSVIGLRAHPPCFSGGLYEEGRVLGNLGLSSTPQTPTNSDDVLIPRSPKCVLKNHSHLFVFIV